MRGLKTFIFVSPPRLRSKRGAKFRDVMNRGGPRDDIAISSGFLGGSDCDVVAVTWRK